MGQIGSTLGNLVGIGQNAGVNTFGASEYGQNYGAQVGQMQNNYNAANAAQTGLAQQYGQIAAGQGPNPAQAQLNQATAANVANQGALAAGQRGAAGNVGMMQRQAANQGRSAQQQAAGQGASMQAQQQLGALGAQGNIYGSQASNAIGGIGAYESAINSANQINAQSAAQRAQFGQGFGGGLLQGVGSMLAKGGEVKMADGGDPFAEGNTSLMGTPGGDYTSPSPAPQQSGTSFGNSFIGQFLSNRATNGPSSKAATGHGIISGFAKGLKGMSKSGANEDPTSGAQSLGSGSTYNTNLSPAGNEMINSPGVASGNAGYAGADLGAGEAAGAGSEAGSIADLLAATGGQVQKLKAQGGHVPGKAKIKGNSYANDTVKALLSPGEVVIPKSVMESGDPVRGAAQFVQAVMAKKRKKA